MYCHIITVLQLNKIYVIESLSDTKKSGQKLRRKIEQQAIDIEHELIIVDNKKNFQAFDHIRHEVIDRLGKSYNSFRNTWLN